jgi:hypothetical protein
MYGLPHGGLIANELLEKRLNKVGCFQSKYLPGLWSHTTCSISFTLVVRNTRSTLRNQSSKNISNAAPIGQAHGTLASHWTGTMPSVAKSTCLCLVSRTKHSNNSNITNLQPGNTLHSNAKRSNMVPRNNTPSKNLRRSL